jgi:glycosyltransferase involved in cell wall biosynthesis
MHHHSNPESNPIGKVLETAARDLRNDESLPLLVSLVIPAYNEGSILQENLAHLEQYTLQEHKSFRWEFIIVNDGSRDDTGLIATQFSRQNSNAVVVHHPRNLGLGQALKSGFAYAQGDYIITLDIDLSYAPYHIEILLEKIVETHAQVVVASPYMEGGQVSNVPYVRKELSIWANRFLAITAKRSLSTFTGMVRAYETNFLKSLNLKATGMDINPEIIHKAQLLGARVEEVPAHLNWSTERLESIQRRPHRPKGRSSSMKIFRHTWAILFYGFIFRPVMFFILPSLVLFLLSLYANGWVLIHCWSNYQLLLQSNPYPDPTVAVAEAFQQAPHTFVIGGMSLMLSIQLFSLGILAVQSKSYFEEIFYLASAIYRQNINIKSKKD